MRRLLVIFMLFLLPIRGLVGDAMAFSMLPGAMGAASNAQPSATNIIAAPAIFYWATALFDQQPAHGAEAGTQTAHPCHMAAGQDGTDEGAHSQCTACEVCHSSAATLVQWLPGLLHTAAPLPEQRQALWRSAEPRWIAKTPVS